MLNRRVSALRRKTCRDYPQSRGDCRVDGMRWIRLRDRNSLCRWLYRSCPSFTCIRRTRTLSDRGWATMGRADTFHVDWSRTGRGRTQAQGLSRQQSGRGILSTCGIAIWKVREIDARHSWGQEGGDSGEQLSARSPRLFPGNPELKHSPIIIEKRRYRLLLNLIGFSTTINSDNGRDRHFRGACYGLRSNGGSHHAARRKYARSARPRCHNFKGSSNAQSSDAIDGGHSLDNL